MFACETAAASSPPRIAGTRSYLYGALGNLWATRGRHVGWVFYAVALVLIAFGTTSSPASMR
jgi:hypothetical protein